MQEITSGSLSHTLARFCLAVLLGLSAGILPDMSVASAQAEWDRISYDPLPNPAGDDRYIAMPCGGRMAFRKVETTSLFDENGNPNWLNDRKIQLGYPGAEIEAVDFLQQRYIQGAFADWSQNSRYYFIGKYEVTLGQYASVMSATCPDGNDLDMTYPVTRISWFDAVDFSAKYTTWLYQNAPDQLPGVVEGAAETAEGGPQSYLRLPTEAEWEFAARGGLAVSDTDFRGKIYPLKDGESLAIHAWYGGAESSRGELNVIGMLEPNPLGLHDILGNVEEFVLEPFRLNRANRLHGQVGGFVTKGGSFRSPADAIRTSRRDEYGYFDPTLKQARKLDTFGFRLVLSAPVQTDAPRIAKIADAWDNVTASTRLDPGSTDPLVVLKALANRTEEEDAVRVIEGAVGQLIEERGQGEELRGQTLRALMASGALAGRFVFGLGQRAANAAKALSIACTYCENTRDEKTCQRCKVQYPEILANAKSEVDNAQNLYMTNLLTTSDEFPAGHWGNALGDLRAQMEAAGTTDLVPYADLFARHVKAHQQTGRVDLDEITRDIDDLGNSP